MFAPEDRSCENPDFLLLERSLHAAADADAAIRTLGTALELVSGQPFAGVRQGYEWAHTQGFVASMETVAAEAHHLAQLAGRSRDPELAQWAACQGLLASPGDESLYRDRMLACDVAGNPAGVEAVMGELLAAVEAIEPYDTLHAETVALYERLSHRTRRAGEGCVGTHPARRALVVLDPAPVFRAAPRRSFPTGFRPKLHLRAEILSTRVESLEAGRWKKLRRQVLLPLRNEAGGGHDIRSQAQNILLVSLRSLT